MARQSEEEILQLIHALRKKSGIKPIPYSEAELSSGVAATFASAMTSRPPATQHDRRASSAQHERLVSKNHDLKARIKHLEQEIKTSTQPKITQQEQKIPDSIGNKPPNHRRSFSIKC
jgi:hypothetical protein